MVVPYESQVGVARKSIEMEMQRVGQVSWSGPVRPSYLFAEVAITLQKWCERASDGYECGVRVEVQQLDQSMASRANSEFAARILLIAGPIWRADLFTLSTGLPGNFDRAHFHPRFIGDEPCDRQWDAALTRMPFGWLQENLENMSRVFTEAGFADLATGHDVRRIREMAPGIVSVARSLMDEVERVAPEFVPSES